MNKIIPLFLLSSIMLHSALGLSASFYENSRRKQEKKEAQRWSLSQWLEQKQKIKLMDSWLMYNAPSPYEFFFGIDTASVKQTNLSSSGETTGDFRNYRGTLGAFVTLVGLYGEYESSNEELSQWKALFLLRALGSSDQSTNLTLGYGLMERELNNETTQYQVARGQLTLYLIRAFALSAAYELYLEAESNLDNKSKGQRTEVGAHIEYGALRIYGSWFQEKLSIHSPTLVESERAREGVLFGARLYF